MSTSDSHTPPVLLQQLPECVPVAPLLSPACLLLLLLLLALSLLQLADVLLKHLQTRQPVKRLHMMKQHTQLLFVYAFFGMGAV